MLRTIYKRKIKKNEKKKIHNYVEDFDNYVQDVQKKDHRR